MTDEPGTDCTNSHFDSQSDSPLPFWAPTRAARLVRKHNRRAEKRGLPATLTPAQWQRRIAETGGKCYFCGAEAESLEHRVPMHWGGGTTYQNCVPCCIHCNEIRNYVGQAVLVLDSPVVADLLPPLTGLKVTFAMSMSRSTKIMIALAASLIILFAAFLIVAM